MQKMKRSLVLAAAWIGLGAMQAQQPPRPAEIALWRLDCGEIDIAQYGAFFSDTFQYPSGPKRVVGSCFTFERVMPIAKARVLLGQAYEARGNPTAARASYEKVESTWPKGTPSRTLKRAAERLAALPRP